MAKNTAAAVAAVKALTIPEIEEQIWKLEGIRVILRLPRQLASTHPGGYDWERASNHDACVAHIADRLKRVFGQLVQFVIVRGDGKVIDVDVDAKRTSAALAPIRNSYKAPVVRAKKVAAK